MENNNVYAKKSVGQWLTWGIKDIFTGWSVGEAIYAYVLIGIQIVALFVDMPSAEAMPLWLRVTSFLTGLTGTICVLLVSKGKISNYFFGAFQTFVGIFVTGYHRLIGETLENMMYFVFQFIGFKEWSKHMKPSEDGSETGTSSVKTLKFHWLDWVVTVALIVILTYVLGNVFMFFGGNFSYTSAFSVTVAVIAQIMMTFRYREQWVIWFSLNVVTLWQFFNAGNASMVALYIAFTINSVYGFYTWTKTAEIADEAEPFIIKFRNWFRSTKKA